MSDEVMTREEETTADGEEGAEVQDAPTEETPTPPELQVWQVWGRLQDTHGHLVLVASEDPGRAVSIRAIVGKLGDEGDMITLTPEGMSALILAGAAYLENFEAQGGKVKA